MTAGRPAFTPRKESHARTDFGSRRPGRLRLARPVRAGPCGRILAGGVTIVNSPLTLPVGRWQNVRFESNGQLVTRFTSLDDPHTVLESFQFNEGQGIITTGSHGTVLNLANTQWVRVDHDRR